jgi:glutathione S-transferase
MIKRTLEVGTSVLASTLAAWRGTMSPRPTERLPQKPLELYEFEACPHCRLVREALTELDLDALIHPCPKGGKRFRSKVQTLGGKQQYPFLVDPNTGARLYEAASIVAYLGKTYGGAVRKPQGLRRRLMVASSMAATAARSWRGPRGLNMQPSKAPRKPLELYSFESSPYSRLARETLCELELPYLLRNTGKARMSDMGPPSFRDKLFKGPKDTSRNRKALYERTGQVQVPYLIDPNTGVEMYESAAIVKYLEQTYAG